MRSRFMGLVCALAALASPAVAQSVPQPVTIRLHASDFTGGAVVESALLKTLRKVRDVQIVEASERADLFLTLLVSCAPKTCIESEYEENVVYTVALNATQPFDSTHLPVLFFTVRHDGTAIPLPVERAIRTELMAEYDGYARPVRTWTFGWTPDTYLKGVEDVVRVLNTRCLERIRLLDRSIQADLRGDSTAARQLTERFLDEHFFECWRGA